MQKQTVRQQARVRARQARAKVREEQMRRDRRLAKWGEQVAVALAERDASVTEHEQRAGRALRSLIEEEGLGTQEALAWCGDDTLTGREVYRLIRGVEDDGQAGDDARADQEAGEGPGTKRREVEPGSAGPAESTTG